MGSDVIAAFFINGIQRKKRTVHRRASIILQLVTVGLNKFVNE
jgi:hypothetical protein